MSHIPYTIIRSGMIYYNRRVPKHVAEIYGPFVRHALSRDPVAAAAYADRISKVLDASWSKGLHSSPVDIASIVDSFKPQSYLLSEMGNDYLGLRGIDERPSRTALGNFISLAGDREVDQYTRHDARLLVQHLTQKGNKTATIRRRINSLSAIFNFAFSELDLDKRNPFARLMIQGEGEDSHKRGVFTKEQLTQGYRSAISSGSTVKLLMPLLGETGCRLAEIVGLRLEDIDLEEDLIHIRPNSARRLKTSNSTRILPLVGYAKLAMERANERPDGKWLFPRYIKDGICKATHASNALNKWLKKDFDGLTAHCLRHTIRDRLRAVECPMEMIDQIGGWRSVGGVGSSYGQGYSVGHVRGWLQKIEIGP